MKAVTLSIFCSILGFCSLVYIGGRLNTYSKSQQTPYDLPPLVELPPNLIELLTLGHSHIYHDFLNLFLLQSLTENPKNPDADRMEKVILSVISHKPEYETLYLISCFTIDLNYKRPETCRPILETGFDLFPRSFRVANTYAHYEGFILNNPDRAATIYYYLSTVKGAPKYLKGMADKLAKRAEITDQDLKKSLEGIVKGSPRLRDFLKKQSESRQIKEPHSND